MAQGKYRHTLNIGGKRSKYSNCKIYHPSGKLMCINSERKGQWYVNKTNAKILEINKDGTLAAIQLTFEPKGFGYNEDETFGLSVQTTRCVVSGNTDVNILTRHHIIPSCYRRLLPEEYKSKNHHDVVFLTEKVHDDYERISVPYRDEIHRMYGVPTEHEIYATYRAKLNAEMQSEVTQLKNAAHALLQNQKMTTDIRVKNEILILINVKKIFNVDLEFITSEWLERIIQYTSDKAIEIRDKYYVDPFKVLIDKVTNYEEFIIMWRKHFVETMKPEFLPIGWAIENKCKVEFNRK